MFRELGNKRGMATALKQWAVWLFVAQGDQAIVRARLEDSLTLFGELGDKGGIAFYSWASGWVALSQGDSVTAQNLVEQSLTLWRELGNRWYTALSLGMLGKIATQRGDLGVARALHEESLAIARASHDNWLTALCLEALAAVVTAQGEVVWAARLWGAAEALRDTTGSPLPPVFRADYERSVAAARTQLGEKTFAAAWAEGRSMTPEQVLAAAIADPKAPTRSGGGPPTRTPVSKRVPEGLTPREVEVLRLLVVLEGPTNQEMAEQLGIEAQTVHAHLRSIYSKLGVSTRSAAMSYAIKHQLV